MHSANTPVPLEDVQGDNRWMSLHQRCVTLAKEKETEILFLGDSIIQRLELTNIWEKMFVPLHCLNFGIGGDTTQNLLWRIMNGELDYIRPKIVVIHVGTNNYTNTAIEVSDGILSIVSLVHKKQPQSHIIVMGIPPRGQYPNRLRDKNELTNKILKENLMHKDKITYLQVDNNIFINQADGTIDHSDMFDFLHFTDKGYQKFTEPLLDEINNLLMSFVRTDSMDAPDAETIDGSGDI